MKSWGSITPLQQFLMFCHSAPSIPLCIPDSRVVIILTILPLEQNKHTLKHTENNCTGLTNGYTSATQRVNTIDNVSIPLKKFRGSSSKRQVVVWYFVSPVAASPINGSMQPRFFSVRVWFVSFIRMSGSSMHAVVGIRSQSVSLNRGIAVYVCTINNMHG